MTARALTLPGQRVRIVGIPSWEPNEGAWTIMLRVEALHWDGKAIEAAVDAVVHDRKATVTR